MVIDLTCSSCLIHNHRTYNWLKIIMNMLAPYTSRLTEEVSGSIACIMEWVSDVCPGIGCSNKPCRSITARLLIERMAKNSQRKRCLCSLSHKRSVQGVQGGLLTLTQFRWPWPWPEVSIGDCGYGFQQMQMQVALENLRVAGDIP
jgi:hypothetical protein